MTLNEARDMLVEAAGKDQSVAVGAESLYRGDVDESRETEFWVYLGAIKSRFSGPCLDILVRRTLAAILDTMRDDNHATATDETTE